jgi:acylphosphatase
MSRVRKRVIVSGIVQGVNFRRYTQMTAQGLGVNGWVRNLPDGRVEGCFEGSEDTVDSLVEWCRKGPPAGRVDAIEVVVEPFAGEFNGFNIRY